MKESVMFFYCIMLFMYSFCIFSAQNPLPYSIVIDNSTRQEIDGALQKNCTYCLTKYGTKRTMCMLSLPPQTMWQQFKEFDPYQRSMFLQQMPLDDYDAFFQRIQAAEWDAWYYTLPHHEQHQLYGSYAQHKKNIETARFRGDRVTDVLAKPLLMGLLAVVVPQAIFVVAGYQIVALARDYDPLKKNIQEQIFNGYKKHGP